MNKSYKILSINFKQQHKELYQWLKKQVDTSGSSFSHIIREMIKKEMEKGGTNEQT